jgi:nicotinamide-nucleotide amidase
MTNPGSAGPARALRPAGLPGQPETGELADLAIQLLTASARTVAVAESLTGGLVTGALTSIAGASVVVRGGVVAYATELKAQLLGVPTDLLARQGPVDPDVAAAMADGVRRLLGATFGLATTGVAGPGPADGKPQGTVFVAVAGPTGISCEGRELPGDRRRIRDETVRWALSMLVGALREDAS